MKEPEELAEDHWKYIERLLEMHGEDDEVVDKIGFHYVSAFVHGFKHARDVYKMGQPLDEHINL